MFSKKCKQHLVENEMTGLQHLKFAWKLAWQCKKTAGALFIHGMAPRFFEHYASTSIKKMHKQMED